MSKADLYKKLAYTRGDIIDQITLIKDKVQIKRLREKESKLLMQLNKVR